MGKRFPARVFAEGSEPDPRFSLANERTFLAWIRTGLALMLTGVAIEAFDAPVETALRAVASLMFIGLGLLAVVHGWNSWASTERSLRRSEALPGMALGGVVAALAAVAIVIVAVGSVL